MRKRRFPTCTSTHSPNAKIDMPHSFQISSAYLTTKALKNSKKQENFLKISLRKLIFSLGHRFSSFLLTDRRCERGYACTLPEERGGFRFMVEDPRLFVQKSASPPVSHSGMQTGTKNACRAAFHIGKVE